MLYRRSLFFPAAIVMVLPTTPLLAQNPADAGFDEKMVERLKKILEASPQEGFVLDKLITTYKTYKTADLLIKEYETRAGAEPDKAALQLILGLLYKAGGRDAEAKLKLEAASKLDPKNINTTLALAGLAEKANDSETAKRLYEQSLAAMTDKISRRDLLRRLIGINLAQKDVAKAKEYAAGLVKTDPGNIYVALEFPQLLSKSGFYEEAITELNRLLAGAEDGKAKVAILKEIGAAYEAKDDYKQAISTYEKALGMTLKGNSARSDLRERIVSAYRKNDDVRTYIASLEKEAKGFEELELLGRLYEEVGKDDLAARALEKALSADAKHLEVRERLIRIYDRMGSSEEAVAQYRALIKAAPNDPRWPILLAERLYNKGGREEALKILADMRKRYAGDPSVRVSLADLYGRFESKEEALKEFEALAKLEPKEESHIINLGETYWELGRKGEAEATWKRLLTVISEPDRAYAIYAETIESHLYHKEAIEAYKIAIEKNPAELSYQVGLAKTYRSYGKNDEALKTWEKLKANPKASRLVRREAREQIITIYKEQKTLPAQIELALKAFNQTPPDLEQGAFLALAYTQSKEQDREAISILKKLTSLDANNTEYLIDLAAAYERQNELEAAIPIYERLALLEPGKAKDYFNKISEHLAVRGRDQESLSYAQKALDLSTSDADAYAKLGDIYQKQAKLPEAIAAYEKAISLNRRQFAYYLELAGLYREQLRFRDSAKLLQEVIARGSEEFILKAAGQAIDFAQDEEERLQLEKEVLLLFNTPPRNKVYRKILVELYVELSKPHIGDLLFNKEKAAAAQAKLSEFGSRAMLAMADALLEAGDDQKTQVIELLGYFKSSAGVLPLSTVLDSKDKDPRILAAISLGRIGDKSAVSALGRTLGSAEGDPEVRAAAAWALGELKSPNAVSYLITKKLQGLDDPSPLVRVFSLFALARLNDPSSVPEILSRLSSNDINNTAAVRQTAALALGMMASKQATAALLTALADEDIITTKIAMLRALGAIGDESTLPVLLREAWSQESAISTQAVFAIAHFGEPIVMPPSVQISERLFSKDSPASAITKESFTRDTFATPLSRKDASALLLAHQSELEDSLKEALNSSRRGRLLTSLDEEDRLLSLGGLIGASEEHQDALRGIVTKLSPKLISLLNEKETAENKARIIRILGKAKIEAATEAITKILQGNKTSLFPMQTEAAKALGRINTAATQKTLQELSKNPEDFLRLAAANAYGASGDLSNERALLVLLDDPELLVRSGALWALEQIGSTELSLAGLERLSKRPEPQTRVNVARALAKSNSSKAADLLRILAEDQDAMVALAAKEALARRLKK